MVINPDREHKNVTKQTKAAQMQRSWRCLGDDERPCQRSITTGSSIFLQQQMRYTNTYTSVVHLEPENSPRLCHT